MPQSPIDLFSEYSPERGEGTRGSEKSYLMGEIVPGLHEAYVLFGEEDLHPLLLKCGLIH